jgi:hydroxymethylglutaryl-CoA lyase
MQNATLFVEKILKNTNYVNVYNLLGKPRPFDVSLRDGLQALSKEEQKLFTTEEKIKKYNQIICDHFPKNIEIGSFVNSNILPIFSDTDKLLNYVNGSMAGGINNYVLVPNMTQLQHALKFGASNFSFITSVSESFQHKNTKMSLSDSLLNINEMMLYLHHNRNYELDETTGELIRKLNKHHVKIYVSCINHCPIEGEIKMTSIISQIMKINKLNPNKICLSDTCGNLKLKDFSLIINYCKQANINIKNFSLHLHIHPDREKEAEKIMFFALDNGINEFDVSDFSSGGCSVTMKKSELAPNMNYEQYYRFLTKYLMDKI